MTGVHDPSAIAPLMIERRCIEAYLACPWPSSAIVFSSTMQEHAPLRFQAVAKSQSVGFRRPSYQRFSVCHAHGTVLLEKFEKPPRPDSQHPSRHSLQQFMRSSFLQETWHVSVGQTQVPDGGHMRRKHVIFHVTILPSQLISFRIVVGLRLFQGCIIGPAHEHH